MYIFLILRMMFHVMHCDIVIIQLHALQGTDMFLPGIVIPLHIHRVSKKLFQLTFCSMSVKYEPILIKI